MRARSRISVRAVGVCLCTGDRRLSVRSTSRLPPTPLFRRSTSQLLWSFLLAAAGTVTAAEEQSAPARIGGDGAEAARRVECEDDGDRASQSAPLRCSVLCARPLSALLALLCTHGRHVHCAGNRRKNRGAVSMAVAHGERGGTAGPAAASLPDTPCFAAASGYPYSECTRRRYNESPCIY